MSQVCDPQTANNGPVWPASVKFPRNIFQLLGICFLHFFQFSFFIVPLLVFFYRWGQKIGTQILNCQKSVMVRVWPRKNQVSENFPLYTKRVFSWLSKNFQRTRSQCSTERVFSWLLARLIDICFSKWGDSLPIPNWKHPLAFAHLQKSCCSYFLVSANLVAAEFIISHSKTIQDIAYIHEQGHLEY